MAVLALAVCLCGPAHAAERDNYVSFSPGFYFFNDELDEAHPFGWYSDLIYGRVVASNVSLETGIAYMHEGNPVSDVRADMVFVGLTFFLKPPQVDTVRMFGGAAVGVGTSEYLGTLRGNFLDDSRGFSYMHLMYGVHYDISPRFFVALEQKFLFTESVEYNDLVKVNLNGYSAGIRAGFRF